MKITSKKKKIIILSVMVALLVVTGFLNITLNNGTVIPTASTTTTENFFVTYRTDRNSTRSQEVLYYDAIISSASASAEAKQVAENKKADLIKLMETELVLEGLIKSKGFEDAIVTMSTQNINIIVKDKTLESSEVAQIVQVVQESTGKDIDNIKIIPVE